MRSAKVWAEVCLARRGGDGPNSELHSKFSRLDDLSATPGDRHSEGRRSHSRPPEPQACLRDTHLLSIPVSSALEMSTFPRDPLSSGRCALSSVIGGLPSRPSDLHSGCDGLPTVHWSSEQPIVVHRVRRSGPLSGGRCELRSCVCRPISVSCGTRTARRAVRIV